MPRRTAPEYCANCGAQIPPHARACPECGADERTGWDSQDVYDGVELPEDEETRHADRLSRDRREGHRWVWLFTAVVVLLLLVLGALWAMPA